MLGTWLHLCRSGALLEAYMHSTNSNSQSTGCCDAQLCASTLSLPAQIDWAGCEQTALHRAAQNGHIEIASLLLDKGATVNKRSAVSEHMGL